MVVWPFSLRREVQYVADEAGRCVDGACDTALDQADDKDFESAIVHSFSDIQIRLGGEAKRIGDLNYAELKKLNKIVEPFDKKVKFQNRGRDVGFQIPKKLWSREAEVLRGSEHIFAHQANRDAFFEYFKGQTFFQQLKKKRKRGKSLFSKSGVSARTLHFFMQKQHIKAKQEEGNPEAAEKGYAQHQKKKVGKQQKQIANDLARLEKKEHALKAQQLKAKAHREEASRIAYQLEKIRVKKEELESDKTFLDEYSDDTVSIFMTLEKHCEKISIRGLEPIVFVIFSIDELKRFVAQKMGYVGRATRQLKTGFYWLQKKLHLRTGEGYKGLGDYKAIYQVMGYIAAYDKSQAWKSTAVKAAVGTAAVVATAAIIAEPIVSATTG
ncbi:MAG: hypothetical protein ACPGUZ_00400 [Holosporaceae bacterium]